MALMKSIMQDNGVVTNYHRILLIESVINSHTSISVLSYINQEGRQKDSSEVKPYKVGITYETDYTENMTIENAYNYLKTLPEFEGAIDI